MRPTTLIMFKNDGTYEIARNKRGYGNTLCIFSDVFYVHMVGKIGDLEVYLQAKSSRFTKQVRWLTGEGKEVSMSINPVDTSSRSLAWYVANIEDTILRDLFTLWLNAKEVELMNKHLRRDYDTASSS